MRRTVFLVLLLIAVLGVPSANAEVGLEKVGDFERPVYVAGAPGDDARLYVVEQRGTIQVVENGTTREFLDLREAVSGPDDADAGSEEGMTSMAFPPDFATSRRFYVYFTEAGGGANRVEEIYAPTGDSADPTSRRLVISIPHTEGEHHNGGQIQFGGSGLLYIAPGDGGTGGAPARDLDSLLGKLLRIDPRGDAPGQYAVPAGNPFAGQAGRRSEIWAYGLRNPFRFSFDRLSGDLTIGDVGETKVEEIDYLPAADGIGRGANLGWNACEGSFKKGSLTQLCGLVGSVLPAIEKTHAEGFRAIVNGYVVRDPSLPSLYGRLVYGDFYVDALRSALLGPGGASDDREVGQLARVPRITSFGEDAGGCVYATSYLGGVYRLVEGDARVPCAATASLPPEDSTPPALTASVEPRQRVLKISGVVAYVRCSEACRVSVDGRLRIGGRSYRLREAALAIAPAQRGRVRVALTATGRRVLRRALAKRRTASVRMALEARDPMGNVARSSRTIRVKR